MFAARTLVGVFVTPDSQRLARNACPGFACASRLGLLLPIKLGMKPVAPALVSGCPQCMAFEEYYRTLLVAHVWGMSCSVMHSSCGIGGQQIGPYLLLDTGIPLASVMPAQPFDDRTCGQVDVSSSSLSWHFSAYC